MSSGAGPACGQPVIRLLHGDDVPLVADLMSLAFDPAYGESWTKAQCLAIFALPGYRMAGAMAGGGRGSQMAGFAIDRTVGGHSELLLLAVDPRRRSQGIGQALVNDWVEHCSTQGVEQLFLEVRADNPALEFYHKLGFSQIGHRPDYYRGNDGIMRDAITMSRLLTVVSS